MKKIILMVALISVIMTGCSRQQTDETIIDMITESASQTTMNKTEGTTIVTEPAYEAETQASESVAETTDVQDDDYEEKASAAYKTTLENMLYNYTLPDGATFTEDDVFEMSYNSFAVYDVDNDGRDELVLLYTDTYMAAMAGYILDCDNGGNIETQFLSYPSFTFYDNGVIEVDASHGSGLSGEFWPYTLCSYNSETDSYAEAAYVDGYDKKSMDEMYEATQDPQYIYPTEIDKSGSGVVYVVADGENAKFFDSAEYEEWHGTWVGNSAKLELPYMALTQENIDKAFEG